MTSIIFHTQGTTPQENVSYVLDIYVSCDAHFPNFGGL